ncbi:hypothetical protein PLESTB_001137300 [Pleodorina starrii]|uniref:Uncharacterized protein n=1 Tax=Pleodorina starrii TaxID=330485 RepID=A0A9W6BR59_9CHLO|nr:hypothetical protein PLESTM_000567500 [Pleodorina starrii]GLC56709.1 hypothetical protein PLESTB_001137300 [Pleodorina starrii]GLC66867.1 hypothetical protein PLESTF_000484800 [Pleodorina starrii]
MQIVTPAAQRNPPPPAPPHAQLQPAMQPAAAAAPGHDGLPPGSRLDLAPASGGLCCGVGVGAFRPDRISFSSLSQPLDTATSADFDDAIMESIETELFEGDGLGPSGATVFTSSSQLLSSSSAMACLAQGFSRLPDCGGSASVSAAPRCAAGGGGAGGGGGRGGGRGGAASASALTGGGHGTASATLTEALRCGGGGGGAAAAAAGGGAAAAAGAGYSSTVRSSVVAAEALALKPAGVSHDGVMSSGYGRMAVGAGGGVAGCNRAYGPNEDGAPRGTSSRESGAPTHIAVQRQSQPPPRQQLVFDSRGEADSAFVRQPSQAGAAVSEQHQAYTPGWASGSGTLPLANAAGSCSSSASTVHPALAQVLAAAAAAGRGGGAAAAAPHAEPDSPFTTGGGAAGAGTTARGGGGSGGAAVLGSNSPTLSWELGPIGPMPVTAAPPAQGSGLAGSIAAAAFRSVSSLTGHPSLAAPYGSGGGAASASTSLTGTTRPRGGRLAAAAAADGRRRQAFSQNAPLSRSEPWAAAVKAADAQSGGGGGGGLFPPANLFDVLPDISAGTAEQDGGEERAAAAAAAAGVAGGVADVDAVSAAVLALLRLDQPFDLPYTQMLPPPEYEEALHVPSVVHAELHDADAGVDSGDAAFAPVLPPAATAPLPPLPLPASMVASLEPSGVPAVDRYLYQLLLDPSADRHVFLCKRPLGPAACRAVASCLQVCPGVKSITLSYCGITCEGVAALCEGLRTCRELLVLDLSYNAIGDAGAASLAACLAVTPSLTSLTLTGNPDLSDVGAAALAAAARGGGGDSLRRIGLRGTAASQFGLRELASVLAANLKRAARRGSGTASPVAAAAVTGGGERPMTWDGTLGSSAAAAAAVASDALFIAQLCGLLQTFVQPALAAEKAVAEAVAELMAAAPGSLAGGGAAVAAATAAAAPPADNGEAGESDLLSYLADGLTARGYNVAVTHALGGGSGGECLRNLRHTFLAVTCPLPPGMVASGPPSPAAAVAAASLARSAGSACGRRRGSEAAATAATSVPYYHPGVIIVDPELREQFEVATPTPRYEALVSALPRVYVGAEERLPMVVEVLCDEMGMALRSKGMVIPPWRESAAMISKWQPKQAKMLVSGAAAAAAGAGGLGSGSGSAKSSAGATPRVSLAGGMAAAAGGCTAPVPMLHRRLFNGGASAAGVSGAAASATGSGGRGREAAFRAAVAAAAAAAAAGGGGDGEPSLGPAPSLGSASGADGSRAEGGPLVQSFGFRRCTSANSFSVSVGLMAPISAGGGCCGSDNGNGAAAAAAAAARGGAAGLSSAFADAAGAAAAAAAAAAATTAGSGDDGACISLSEGLGPPPVPFGPPRPRMNSGPAAIAAAAAAAATAAGCSSVTRGE